MGMIETPGKLVNVGERGYSRTEVTDGPKGQDLMHTRRWWLRAGAPMATEGKAMYTGTDAGRLTDLVKK